MGYMGKDDQMISLAMSYEEVQMNASWVHSQTTWIFVCVNKWKRGTSHYEIHLKYTLDTSIGTPRNSYGGTNALICGINKTLNIAVNSLRIVFYYLENATLKAF